MCVCSTPDRTERGGGEQDESRVDRVLKSLSQMTATLYLHLSTSGSVSSVSHQQREADVQHRPLLIIKLHALKKMYAIFKYILELSGN